MLTVERARELLSYNLDTGIFVWLKSKGAAKKGSTAGSVNSKGYLHIKINGKNYKAHALAWLFVHGEYPSCELDHRNRIKIDNWIDNLRLSTRSNNNFNIGLRVDNKSGCTGVSWHISLKLWVATICKNKNRISLGSFDCLDDAINARKSAELFYFPNIKESGNDFRQRA
jgi:hypothetical protein